MTSEDISINSTNFSVDKNGSMSCSSANITGGNVNLKDNGTLSGGHIIATKNNDNTQKAYFSSSGVFAERYYGSKQIAGTFTNDNFNIGISQDEQALCYIQAEIDATTNTPELKVIGNNAKIITDGAFKVRNAGTVMYGKNETPAHSYQCNWTGSALQFYVDNTYVGTLSDKRLKTEIKDIDQDFINAIKEIEMKQFKVANRNGLVSFGILAQDLIDIFEKYNKNPFEYEIVQKTQYRDDDDTIYYTIDYEQFLVLKTKAQEIEIQELQTKDKEKDNLIQSLIQRVEALEKGEK